MVWITDDALLQRQATIFSPPPPFFSLWDLQIATEAQLVIMAWTQGTPFQTLISDVHIKAAQEHPLGLSESVLHGISPCSLPGSSEKGSDIAPCFPRQPCTGVRYASEEENVFQLLWANSDDSKNI